LLLEKNPILHVAILLLFEKQIYPKEPTLNKVNITSESYQFLDLEISLSQGNINTHVYDKRYIFPFPIISFPFLNGDVPLA
jgi:hypothetical protein